jgi:hypothetical protein
MDHVNGRLTCVAHRLAVATSAVPDEIQAAVCLVEATALHMQGARRFRALTNPPTCRRQILRNAGTTVEGIFQVFDFS